MRDPQFFVDTAAPDHAQNVEAAADARIGRWLPEGLDSP
jgi:hypothetical protein